MIDKRNIKKFGVDGVSGSIEDAARVRPIVEREIIEQMRHDGYVPILDLDPMFTTSYNEPEDKLNWTISIRGVYLGKVKSWQVEGISQNKPIPRRTPQPK